MLRNTIQHYLYWKQEVKNEIIKFVKLLRLIVWILIPFSIAEMIRVTYFSNIEFFLSFIFFVVVMLLIIYWIPDKKEFKEWKKTHSTF